MSVAMKDPSRTLLLAGKQGLTNIRVAQVNAPELFKVTAAGTVGPLDVTGSTWAAIRSPGASNLEKVLR